MIMNRPGPQSANPQSTADAGLVPQLAMMIQALWASAVRDRLLLLSGALFSVIVATAYGQIRLNNWNQPFYDALSRRDFAQFMHQLGVFGVIAGSLLVLNVAQRWLGEMAKVKMREGLVQDLVGNWMQPRRAFKLAHAGPIGVNPDQRMHEDARHLTELSADLGIGLLQASILLVTFIDILWKISGEFAFDVAGHDVVVPGYMVWAAIIYAGSASLLSYRVGRGLVDRNEEHYAREADLRYALVRVSEHIDSISLAGGEAHEARHIAADLDAVLAAMRRLVYGLANLTWVTAGSGWFTLIAPILAAVPLYFAGKISFGGLMLASGAFLQVQSSLRWFVDNFSTIADWRATLLRVASFRRATLGTDVPDGTGPRIEVAAGAKGRIVIADLSIDSPSGRTRLVEGSLTIAAGDHVLISGDSGSGKTLLFRTLAGLWPWGSGRILRPPDEEILYLPRTPYTPPGTLREVLAYPSTVDAFAAAAYPHALARLGLERLVPLLDSTQRWDRDLSEYEQQRLAFARVVVRAPAWLLIDDVLDTLDERTLAQVLDVFGTELARTGIIHIGRCDAPPSTFARVLHVIKDADGRAPAAARSGDER